MSRDRDYLAGGIRLGAGPTRDAATTAAGLSVLIVGYRRVDLLEQCLAAVARHLDGHRVLVWDNSGPHAPGLAELVAAHPQVTWRLSPTNVGFAAAVNALADMAGDDDLLLLNPDAELLGPLRATRATIGRPGVAAAAPLIVEAAAGESDGRRYRDWDVAHRELTVPRALVAHSGYAHALRGRSVSDLYPSRPDDVSGYLTGACLLISRAAWRAIGPFDEEFFLYGEESDWQQRARRNGWRLVLVNEPGARHSGHGTVAGDPAAAQRSVDLLRANVALNLEHSRGVHRADVFLAGLSVLDRVQRSRRRERRAVRRPHPERPGVVITTNRLVFGGAERQHALLAQELTQRGHEVVIVCVQRLGPLIREIAPSVRVVRQPWWAPAPELGPGPAVVISGDTNTETGYAALWRRRRQDRRWLVAAHTPPDPAGPTYSRALAGAMRAADGFIALSPRHWEQATAHQDLGRRWFVAPNGVVSDSPALEARQNRPRDPGRPLQLVMLARIVAHKNPHLLVAALDGLRELDWELSIFGDGPDRERLEALTPADLNSRVHWRGWSPGPDEALRDCDLLCVPSELEAFPLVILEAMARAVPVAASAVCAVPDMLDSGRAGILVEPVDVAGWRSALREVLTRPEQLPALGRRGLDRMRARYTVQAMADAYQDAIERAFAETGSALTPTSTQPTSSRPVPDGPTSDVPTADGNR